MKWPKIVRNQVEDSDALSVSHHSISAISLSHTTRPSLLHALFYTPFIPFTLSTTHTVTVPSRVSVS